MKLFMAVALCFALLFLAALVPAHAMPAGGKKPSVELGKKLFSDPSLGTNGSTCAGCHPSEAQIAQLAAKKEWFGGKAKTLEQAINICIKGPLAGTPLPEDSVEVRSIAMYMKSQIKK